MVAFHFHCSGPGEVVIDVLGSRIQGGAGFFYGARRAAREVLSLYPSIDPSRWHVTIQDGAGFQVEAYRFEEVLGLACVPRGVLFSFTHGTPEAAVHRA